MHGRSSDSAVTGESRERWTVGGVVVDNESHSDNELSGSAESLDSEEEIDTGAEQSVVTVAFRQDLISKWLTTGVGPAMLVQLADQLMALGLHVRQVHPGASDPQLASWFEITAPQVDEARRALAYLRGHPAVVAAFIKPPDALPG
jgi:hypothetical protein